MNPLETAIVILWFSGNDFIHHVTSGQREYALRVDMVDMAGAAGHALYGRFSLGDAQSQYTIRVKDFEGTIGWSGCNGLGCVAD